MLERVFMLKKTVLLLSVFISNLLSVRGEAAEVVRALDFPPASERGRWEQLTTSPVGRQVAAEVISQAEKICAEPIPQLTAEKFMQFRRKWNRIDYEDIYFQKRWNFYTLILAECMEYRGRFMDKIMDYIWDITGEHTWSLPAHFPYVPDPIPFTGRAHLDLYATTTGSDMAVTLLLLEKEIEKVSANMAALIKRKLFERIIEPLEIRPFPYGFIKATNNWRPWCIRNCMVPVLYMLKDQPQRQKKILDLFRKSLTEYMKNYPEDGGCDEGPTYWGVNPVMIMFCYELLGEMPADQEKFKLMGEFISHAKLTDKYFANFGDAAAKAHVPRGGSFRFGEIIKSEQIKKMSSATFTFRRAGGLFDMLADLFYAPADKLPAAEDKNISSFKYYDRLQLLFLKDQGVALAAKRSFRGSHYHMDIGQFIIFYQGEPIAVDLGNAVYTAETFSKMRFNNWILNSKAHNVPEFNNITQIESPKLDEQAAWVERSSDKCAFYMDLTSAYPKEAKLVKCERIITYSYIDQSVTVLDKWELKQDNNTVSMPLYTPLALEKTGQDFRIGNMRLSIRGDNVKTQVTPLTMTDRNVIVSWGKKINRLDIVSRSGAKGSCELRFEPLKAQ
ncbi:MAG: hypothetical protein E7052_08185 [Lentisphaerae bacterium]|nr:hypothetical protein [Lentisphaerota bacterium]